eukprot:6383443-Pyramimonas_sp.AAC.1
MPIAGPTPQKGTPHRHHLLAPPFCQASCGTSAAPCADADAAGQRPQICGAAHNWMFVDAL